MRVLIFCGQITNLGETGVHPYTISLKTNQLNKHKFCVFNQFGTDSFIRLLNAVNAPENRNTLLRIAKVYIDNL